MNPTLVLHARKEKKALLIVGPRGSGKTSALVGLGLALQAEGLNVDGVVSPRLLQGAETVGYNVQRWRTGEERLLCSREPPGLLYGRFFFRPEALAFANQGLQEAAQGAEVILVDEVGPLELRGAGFFPGLQACLQSRAFLILTVRPSLASAVSAWLGGRAVTFHLGQPEPPKNSGQCGPFFPPSLRWDGSP